jgi:hypothetical protein
LQKPATISAPPQAPFPSGMSNTINLSAGSGSVGGGLTSIRHQLPTGENIEINLKMTKTGLHQVSRPSTNKRPTSKTTRTPTKKPTTTTMSPILAMLSNMNKYNKKKKKPQIDDDALFEEDDESNTSPSNSALKTQDTLNSLESLKATMLAIQKINDVTVKRKKEGMPVSYPDVLADLKAASKITTTKKSQSPESSKSQSTQAAISAAADKIISASDIPEPDSALLTKLQEQNSRPKKPKRPSPSKAQQTASSLLALSLIKVEDDEVEEDFPDLKPVKGITIRVNGRRNKTHSYTTSLNKPSATNNASSSLKELSTLLESIKAKKKYADLKSKNKGSSTTGTKGSLDKAQDEEPEDEEDEPSEADDDEEDDDTDPHYEEEIILGDEEGEYDADDMSNYYRKSNTKEKSPKEQDNEPEERELVVVPEKEDQTSAGTIIATQTFIAKRKSTPSASRRRPKILYPYDSVEFPRLIPL